MIQQVLAFQEGLSTAELVRAQAQLHPIPFLRINFLNVRLNDFLLPKMDAVK